MRGWFKRKPKPTPNFADVAVVTFRNRHHRHTWREGAEERISLRAEALPAGISTDEAIEAISQIVKDEILPEPPHA